MTTVLRAISTDARRDHTPTHLLSSTHHHGPRTYAFRLPDDLPLTHSTHAYDSPDTVRRCTSAMNSTQTARYRLTTVTDYRFTQYGMISTHTVRHSTTTVTDNRSPQYTRDDDTQYKIVSVISDTRIRYGMYVHSIRQYSTVTDIQQHNTVR